LCQVAPPIGSLKSFFEALQEREEGLQVHGSSQQPVLLSAASFDRKRCNPHHAACLQL